jgi:hypothetical protein
VKLMLTSFSIGKYPSIFNRLPPMDIRAPIRDFRPEYSLLILSDKFILDKVSFELLMDVRGPLFKQVGHMTKLLQAEGFLELADYSSIIRENSELLRRMTQNDLASAKQWMKILVNSATAWRTFIDNATPQLGLNWKPYRTPEPEPLLYEMSDSELSERRGRDSLFGKLTSYAWNFGYSFVEIHGHATTANPSQRFAYPIRKLFWVVDRQINHGETSSALERILISYLDYVNANLILSNEMQAGLHDWADFLPFYEQKFITVGYDKPPGVAQAEASHQLFDIAFPEFSVQSPEHLLRLLMHRRVRELRTLIDEASEGKVIFDEDFARSVYREVFRIDIERMKQRRLLGYLTLPMSFIPMIGNFAQPLFQEVAGTMLERRLVKPYRWFYMLSDVATKDRPGKAARKAHIRRSARGRGRDDNAPFSSSM